MSNSYRKENKIIDDLCKVVDSIEEFYYSMPTVHIKNNELKVVFDDLKNYERRFTGALFSNYRALIEDNVLYQGTRPDMEVIKPYIYGTPTEIDNEIKSTYQRLVMSGLKEDPNKFITVPDFFIHKGQENSEEKYQHLIVEVKTYKDLSMIDFHFDLFKLNFYNEKGNYRNAVALVVNSDKSKIISWAKSYLTNNYFRSRKNFDKIYLLIKKSYKDEIEVVKLSDLV
jgi:hypothetical protein